jgi:hypothetical protein
MTEARIVNHTRQPTYATAGTRSATPATTPSQLAGVIRAGRQAGATILAPIPPHDEEKRIAHAIVSARDQALAAAAVAEAAGTDVRQTAGNPHDEQGGLEIVLDETDDDAIPVIGADSFLAGATRRPRRKVGGVFTRRWAGGSVGIDPERHGNSGTEFVADDVDSRAACAPAAREATAMFNRPSELVRSNRPLPWSVWDVTHRRPAPRPMVRTLVARSAQTMDRLWLPPACQKGMSRMRTRRSEVVDCGRLFDAVRIVVDAEAAEYWPQVEAQLVQILVGDEDTVTGSFWRTLKEIESLAVCTHELQEGRPWIVEDRLTAYLVSSACGPGRELPEVTAEARSLLGLPVRNRQSREWDVTSREGAHQGSEPWRGGYRAGRGGAATHTTTRQQQSPPARIQPAKPKGFERQQRMQKPVGAIGVLIDTGGTAGDAAIMDSKSLATVHVKAAIVQSNIRQLKQRCPSTATEQLDRFDKATGPLQQRATTYQTVDYETGGPDFQNGTGIAGPDGSDISVEPGFVIGAGAWGRLEPLGSGVRGRTRGFDSRRLGLKQPTNERKG